MSCSRCFNSVPGSLLPACRLGHKPSLFCDDFRDLEAMANRAAGIFPTLPTANPSAGSARPAAGAPR
ncbi:MAG: hypothetical protein ACLGSA_12645 [Acidobacteriota bacterium]